MQRPNEREFLAAVLEGLEELPPGLAAALDELLSKPLDDRAQAIRDLLESFTGE